MTGVWRLRAAVLTLVGVLAVHHGRYAFSPPRHEHALAEAHAYLSWLWPAAAVALFLTAAHLLALLGRRTGAVAPLPRSRALWPVVTATLLTVFAAQECVEMTFVHGHVPGLFDLLADGGWTAVPFAVVAGGAISALLRGAEKAVLWALTRARRGPRRAATARLRMPRPAVLAAPRSVLARRLAGRGPPALA